MILTSFHPFAGRLARALLLVLFALPLASSASPLTAQSPSNTPTESSSGSDAQTDIAAADARFNRAASERDRGKFRELLSKDAVFFAGEVYRGRLEFMAVWQHLFDGKYDFRYEAETLETTTARSGEFGWSVGTARTSFKRPGLNTAEVKEGHYLNVWHLEESGAEDNSAQPEARQEAPTWKLLYSVPLVVHPTLGEVREPRGALMAAWPDLADQMDARIELQWTPERSQRAASGEAALVFGEYEVLFARPADSVDSTPGSENAPVASETTIGGKGQFLAIWQKDDQGRWNLAAEGLTPPGIYGPR